MAVSKGCFMVTEVGIVMQVQNGSALVRLKRKTECAGCKACLAGRQVGYMQAKVLDLLGASVGDKVEIALVQANAVASGFVLYILPLILLMAGYFAGEALARWANLSTAAETAGILVGIAFFVFTFLGIYLVQNTKKRKKSSIMMTILEIVTA